MTKSMICVSCLVLFLSFTFITLCSFQGTNGGDEESRTPDPLLARQVLSQLSYAPISFFL